MSDEKNYHSLYWLALMGRHRDPENSVKLLQQAREWALEAGDDRATLEITHWLLQTLIFKTRDIATAYPLAVEIAVEARKPQYEDMREHICVYQDLILTYLDNDPLGHEKLIEDAVDYMQGELGDQKIQCRLCLQGLRCDFEVARGNYEQAIEETQRVMAMAEGDFSQHHHQTQAYGKLAEIYFRQADWPRMVEAAQIAVDMAGNSDELHTTACLGQVALAYGHLKTGQPEQAEKQYQQAAFNAQRTTEVMDGIYFEIARAFLMEREKYEQALALAEHELAQIDGKGLLHREAKVQLARCQALEKMGKLIAAHWDPARDAIMRLKNPRPLLLPLIQLLAKNSTTPSQLHHILNEFDSEDPDDDAPPPDA